MLLKGVWGMLRRLASFAEKGPKSAAKVIFALAVALIVVILGVLVAIVDMGNLFEAPYPSETTPLSWDDGSITWTATDTVIFGENHTLFGFGDEDPSDLYAEFGGWGRNYSDICFSWDYLRGGIGGPVVNDSEQQELSRGIVATVEIIAGGVILDGQEFDLSLEITDFQGNGAFDRGDRIIFKVPPSAIASVYADEVYTLALAYLGAQFVYVGVCSFAFHDGKFYSWESHHLSWDKPWWE
ncbi:MAG: MotA/TolQ/ExbB proton channel family protein [Thermoplasmata archaeon]|nr:MotA/TolQ/ExbB proton channel family protein [Thermoplasmata archaeon]